mmetsp:Transcript_29755/g.46007  ORF Transcript_29755/g.46007 Transcript_29755/m.46007 type:complete len:106 (-) Transcript_29755:36-353(-)|eukprot:CAMPEP_0201520834 /NCGR_PEP_ID=MMETSP0161_2-20130828/12850_1 /ASSEMBLY_ACC=CAM_ASM_000251 /TAXON_ID=180227 /ORGANISM="Neoparamoeba aestuarina, Strain SoJaBio B1-5/56/2" /LENGTH=105 /DNA_ID=CAMNT_0047919339 /DNA_START=39 /DNA_END=356 /DNA_ORIENTATION=+
MNNQAKDALGYATLVLHSSEKAITGENIRTVMDAAGIDVLPIYASLFEKYFKSHDIESMMRVQTQGPAQTQAPAAASADTNTNAADKKVEEQPEEDDDMGFGLFD